VTDVINAYTAYLIKQYWEKPKAKSEIQFLMTDWQRIADFIREFGDNFDIDNAEGEVLDLIGRIAGLPRKIDEAVPINYFGFDSNPFARGFADLNDSTRESGSFFRLGLPSYTPYELRDREYRRFLKVKIGKNICQSVIASYAGVTNLQDVIFSAFEGNAYVTDSGDHSLTLHVSPDYSLEELQLLFATDIMPKPITFSYRVVIQVDVGNTFGFSNNPNSKGFADLNDPSREGGRFARLINV